MNARLGYRLASVLFTAAAFVLLTTVAHAAAEPKDLDKIPKASPEHTHAAVRQLPQTGREFQLMLPDFDVLIAQPSDQVARQVREGS